MKQKKLPDDVVNLKATESLSERQPGIYVNKLAQAISKNSVLLSIFAIITTGACVLTYTATTERIEQNHQNALLSQLSEVIPKELYDNDILNNTLTVVDPLVKGSIYQASYKEEPVGVIIPTQAPDGYGGPINLLVGILKDGILAGVRVVPPHLETPGLGDAIEKNKSDWIDSFVGKSLRNTPSDLWAVKKEGGVFDQFTGATITPRATIRAVKKTLLLFEREKLNIMTQDTQHQTESPSLESLNEITPKELFQQTKKSSIPRAPLYEVNLNA